MGKTDTKTRNKHSNCILVKIVDWTPLFSPTSHENDGKWNEHSQTKKRGERATATQFWKQESRWMNNCPDMRQFRLTWQQEKEAQTTELQGVLGVDKSGRGNEGDAENTRTAERQEEPNLLPFPRHWDKAPPAPQQRPKLRMGVREAISTENREQKRTATHWIWRSAAFFVFWLPDVGSHNLQAGDRKILLWESDLPQKKAKPNQSPHREPHGKGFHGIPLLKMSKQLGLIRPLRKACTEKTEIKT